MDYTIRLKELRKENGMTQQAVAEYLNVKQNTYSQYENGQHQLPNDMLVKLALLYNVSTDYIFGLTDIDTPYNKI